MSVVSSDDYSDLRELGIGVSDPLTNEFEQAAKHVQSIAGKLDNKDLLTLYGLYKQAIEGVCNTSKPSWYDAKGKAKWEAWNSLGNLNQAEAKQQYVEQVKLLSPDFVCDQTTTTSKADSWAKVSSFAPMPQPLTQNICDYIREGNLEQVTEYLASNKSNINSLDCSGMGLIHYAADIGDLSILSLLIKKGCDVDLKDSGGQTALHYAAACGHVECVKYLVKNGAQTSIEDSDGCTPKDVACDDCIRDAL
ncbi:acyl-CoA-binding domain-containing protein 6-like [Anthonomus grandis grandis]|uniref:acyl-CoA-binding domain-containing protein 6-like n=1 Tax=Anthonomus grandis grandis TaxID=2921223 RepID=UPI002165F7F9|nr:acyl-CoA-binding domain-containing protein 6-like [Anthonomus grandis grandis]